MIINAATLAEIRKGFSILFKQGLDSAQTQWEQVATRVPGEGAETTYKWLGKFPKMREWIGDRQLKNLAAFQYTIRNKNFEATVSVDRNDIEDNQLAGYNPSFVDMGASAMAHRDELVFGLYLAGFTELCFDGKPMFAADHPVGNGTKSNYSDKKLTSTYFQTAYAAMQQFTDDEGRPLGITPTHLLVGPVWRATARALVADKLASGADNPDKGLVDVIVCPWFGASTKWFLLALNRPIKPVLLQVRQEPRFVALDQETDENVFMRREFIYGVDDRKNVGFGFWQMAYGSLGTQS